MVTRPKNTDFVNINLVAIQYLLLVLFKVVMPFIKLYGVFLTKMTLFLVYQFIDMHIASLDVHVYYM